jgi:hypothetical protein
MNSKWIALGALLLSACVAHDFKYTEPTQFTELTNSKKIKKPKNTVWAEMVSGLSKNFFVINNIDKDSGLINISYTGNPEAYIDCGEIYSYVKDGRGERRYTFAGARAFERYEILDGADYAVIERKVSLDGRMNIVVSEIAPMETNVSVNTRYVVQVTADAQSYINGPTHFSNSLAFNTGGRDASPIGLTCSANGKFEEQVLGIVQ